MPEAVIDEVGPDLFRVSVFVSQVDLQFNTFSSVTRSRCFLAPA